MDLQILYNNPIKARKEKTSMRSYKNRKKNPEKKVYRKNVEYKMIDLLESTPDFEKLKGKGQQELDKALASLEKQFAKKDLFKLGKKKFYTSSEAQKLNDMLDAQIKKAQDLAAKGVPKSDKFLEAATTAKEDYKKLLADEKKAYREEAKAMGKLGYTPAKKKTKDGKEIPLSPAQAAKENKRNKIREKIAEKQAAKLKKLVKKLTSGVKSWKSLLNSLGKKKKKVSKKVTAKKTTKKTYKKPTRKVTKKVSKKKARKKVAKKVAKKVTKKSSKRSAAKKAARRTSKKAGRRSSGKKRNPISVFSNPDFEISENPKKGRKVRRKKKKNSKRSRKAKKSLASQVADMAKPKKKKKKGGRKAKKLKKIKVKALAGHPSKKKMKKKT